MKERGATRLQRGQSLVEFLVAMVFMIPLFLGVYYVSKYADLQQATVQASRYAAFQRAMQPDEARLPTADIEDKLRARFFARGDGFGNGERLASSDGASNLPSSQGQVVFWRDLAGNPLLQSFGQITLDFESEALTPVAAVANEQGAMLYSQHNRPIQRANVEVSLMDHLAGGQEPLKIGASTATMGDAWNAEGSVGVRAGLSGNALSRVSDAMAHLVGQAVAPVVSLFETNGPVMPCVRLEAVPLDRSSGGSGALAGSCQ
jgi:hypothetical protein